MDNLNTPLPYDEESEQSIMADILQKPECFDYISQHLESEDFYNISHKKIFKAMEELYKEGDLPCSLRVKNHLNGKGILNEVGGWDYLSMLNEITIKHKYEVACELIKDAAIKRESINIGLRIQEASNKQNWQDQLKEMSNEFNIVLNRKRDEEVDVSFLETVDNIPLEYKPLIGIDTGFLDLNRIIVGGYLKPQLIVIGARPSIGKTAFALNSILKGVKKGVNIEGQSIYYSLEQSPQQLHHRLLTMEYDRIISTDKEARKLSSPHLRTGDLTAKERAHLEYLAKQIDKLPIIIKRPVNTELAYFYYIVRQIRKKHKIDAIYIDHVGQMTIKGYEGQAEREAFKISHGLQNFAAEMDCAVFALSQLKRALEDRGYEDKKKKPRMSDLRQTGNWEQAADIIIGLYRDEYYNDDTKDKNILEIEVLKHRDGALGGANCFFNYDTQRMTDLEVRGTDPKQKWQESRLDKPAEKEEIEEEIEEDVLPF